ncbi:type II secretion system F family protein [Candidatus Riflebacteria bacterium]
MAKEVSTESGAHVRARPGTQARTQKRSFFSYFNPFHNIIGLYDILIFTKYFSTLTRAGIPVLKSLRILGNQMTKPDFRQKIVQMKHDVEGGVPLNIAFQKNDDIFNNIYISLIRTGEESGRLFFVLDKLGDLLTNQLNLRRRVQTALFYPAFVSLVAFMVVAFLMTFVIPKFATLFKQFGHDLPKPTQLVIWLSDFFTNNFFNILAFIFILFIVYSEVQRRPTLKKYLDRIRLQIAVFGDLILKYNVATFTRNISILFQSGVSIINSMKLSLNSVENLVIRDNVQHVIRDIEGGTTISQALSKTDIMPELALSMIDIGEESGTLDDMLERVSMFYEEEINHTVDTMTSFIEPVLMITLGLIVGTIVVAMYLPIFQMAKVVTGGKRA